MEYVIDCQKLAGRIEPLWFGHNLEHTRSCVWRGLAAQLIRNRKFAGRAEPNGVVYEWSPIGPPDTFFELEEKDAYTRHVDPNTRGRYNEIYCQAIYNYTPGQASGIAQDRLPLTAGKSYQMRLALRSDAALRVSLRFSDAQGKQTYFQRTLDVAPTDWREFACDFTAPADDDHARLSITFDQPGGLFVGMVSLLPVDHFLEMRPDVIDRLKEIGCSILRWPGGNFAGDYRWQDGLLPVDQRGPLKAFLDLETLPHTFGYDNHEIGIDQFIALCRRVGAEPFISLNFGWDSAEDSAAWVEYCNGSPDTPWGRKRAERGHAEPYRVKYWSLGNELGYTHMEGPNDPAEYARKGLVYAEAMRKVDPTIELCMSGIWFNLDNGWFNDALPLLAPAVQHLSHHYYTRQPKAYAGERGDEEFRRVATIPTTKVLTDLKNIWAKVQEKTPRNCHVGVSFDEWNVWWAWYRRPRLPDAIHAASMLNMLCRESRNVGITLGCYFEPVNEGAIHVTPRGAELTGVGRVMAFYTPHIGNELVPLDEQDGAADVDVTASLDRAGKQMVITLVNRAPQAAHDVHLPLRNAQAAKVEARVLGQDLPLHAIELPEQALPVQQQGDALALRLPPHSAARVIVSLR